MQRNSARAVGLVILTCTAAATITALYSTRLMVRLTGGSAWDATVPAFWPLLAVIMIAALVLVARPRHARAAAVVTMVCAAQLVGGGVAASRDWFQVADLEVLKMVTPLTVLLVIAMTVVCGVSLLPLWRTATGWRPRHPGWLVAGALVAAVPPALAGAMAGFSEVALLGQVALTWSLPWGAGIAAGGWLGRPLRRIAALTVAAAPLLTIAVLTVPILPGAGD
ncbi:hypothetical protein [Actinoplanes xinjiangensis]|nr:hypothetical protein [Actinoplanes xinjiangensis]